jgi:prepilin-type N-terminal cleavage/methylation domain-containing protein
MKVDIYKKGFTLLELLVVIAIIGIIGSIVLGSLGDARSSGSEAAVKASLANLTGQSEFYRGQNSGFGTAVAADPLVCDHSTGDTISIFNSDTANEYNVSEIVLGAESEGIEATCAVGEDGGSYAVSVEYLDENGISQNWCADSSGYRGTGEATGGGTGVVAECL